MLQFRIVQIAWWLKVNLEWPQPQIIVGKDVYHLSQQSPDLIGASNEMSYDARVHMQGQHIFTRSIPHT